MALADLLGSGRTFGGDALPEHGLLGAAQFTPRAKRVIYLFMAGGPSQLETWDYKPVLNERQGEQLPESEIGRAHV